ncbi:hypothetical protein C8R43DRAFT_1039885 [Mycena crocata]|nr:hypothetical protein C8R43DRAFT_1039885 [Mycena crocata]
MASLHEPRVRASAPYSHHGLVRRCSRENFHGATHAETSSSTLLCSILLLGCSYFLLDCHAHAWALYQLDWNFAASRPSRLAPLLLSIDSIRFIKPTRICLFSTELTTPPPTQFDSTSALDYYARSAIRDPTRLHACSPRTTPPLHCIFPSIPSLQSDLNKFRCGPTHLKALSARARFACIGSYKCNLRVLLCSRYSKISALLSLVISVWSLLSSPEAR